MPWARSASRSIFGVMRLVNFAHGDYIAFCVFAMLWPSIDAAAIVFAGNLPTVVLDPAHPRHRRRAFGAVGDPGVPPLPQCQSRDHDDRLLRARLRHQVFPADALFEPAEVHRPLVQPQPAGRDLWAPASRCCRSSPSRVTIVDPAGADVPSSSARASASRCAPPPRTSPWRACSASAPTASSCWPSR